MSVQATASVSEPASTSASSARRLAGQALSRAAGAPLIGGNHVELLIDAAENFSAWLDAMRVAQHRILIENYMFRDDDIGREFRAVLIERAEAGVCVRVIYDWLGCRGQSSHSFWNALIDVGGEVRAYNPFQFSSPFGWVSRDHRKLVLIDRNVAFVGGLCISAKWLGDRSKGIAPWRDTAISIRGPALVDVEEAFADIWAQLGEPLSEHQIPDPSPTGDMDLRVIATQPSTAGMFRLDQMIAAMAQRSLWLSDAYFVGLSPYVQALSAAARDGVDVRLLVPGASDLPVIAAMSRSGYRSLLEAGVRVFEWNGAMMHAKTAVADGRWGRVGSSNLNISSWMENCELDVAVEDPGFAASMEAQYLRDLENSTEIVLASKRSVRASVQQPAGAHSGGSTGRAAASALRLAHSVGAALGNRRVLARSETSVLPWFAFGLLGISLIAAFWPRVVAWPLGAITLWIGTALGARYWRLGHPVSNNKDSDHVPPNPGKAE
ncbi:MAG: phospholipase D-like domain-containing protein [Rudaea sp.]